ncbi:GAP family protein [Brachybacterium saurashtrense]|uniref:GAP family protein n=1 Tax=Brachybacterium saurashtrense TaxID=556288 RepID=A0A345YLV8_9MICO|nr:GAP family protein [Brachybacterium saurashtrense]AXK44910.1 GAP family protein [Brachybacterium saurashtrense]RRR21594.1 GAP family protein [Brachybacterium saurashtrense]
MNEVLGALLPIALGIAISPVPLIAVILMLLTPDARGSSLAFLAGWIAALTVVVLVVAILISPVTDSDTSESSPIASTLKLILGAAAVTLGVKQWRGRPRAGEDPVLPRWMSAVDSMTARKACGLGALLAGVNPKNLTLSLAAGVTIGAGGLPPAGQALAIACFVAIASCAVGTPVLGNLLAPKRMRAPLEALQSWLTAHNAAVMTVLLLTIGVTLIGRGIAGF